MKNRTSSELESFLKDIQQKLFITKSWSRNWTTSFFFQKGDEVLYYPDNDQESIKAIVKEYTPQNKCSVNHSSKILTLIDESGNEIDAMTGYAYPISHNTKDLRKRIYLLEDDPILNLYHLMNTDIVITPDYHLGAIIEDPERTPFTITSSFKVTHIINIPTQGFIYIGLDTLTKTRKCFVNLHEITLKRFYFSIELKTYNYLLTIKEIKNLCQFSQLKR